MNSEVSHLYKVTNRNTGEYYVGKHRGLTQETRNGGLYWGSGKRIQNQIKKYGTENFEYQILCVSNTDYIFELESKYVTKELLQDEFCLNIVTGGREPPSKKGFQITEETRQKLRDRIPSGLGQKRSEETKKKMSESALGRKHSKETIEKFAGRTPWNKGKKGLQIHSEEWKLQNSIRNKGNKYNVGRKHMNDGVKNYFVTEQDIKDRELFNLVPGRLNKA
jgi:group I intron endonuclease